MSRMSTSAPGPQELEKIRSEITELLQHKPSSALFLRLAFHDAFTYDSSSSTGGANGSIRNEKELQHSGNEGLSEAIQNLRAIKDKHPSLSHAGDFPGPSSTLAAANTCNGSMLSCRFVSVGRCRRPGELWRATCTLRHRLLEA